VGALKGAWHRVAEAKSKKEKKEKPVKLSTAHLCKDKA
jgi:hypothetical protein